MARINEPLLVLIFHFVRFLKQEKIYKKINQVFSLTESIATFEMGHHGLIVLDSQRQSVMLFPSSRLPELLLFILLLCMRSVVSNRSRYYVIGAQK